MYGMPGGQPVASWSGALRGSGRTAALSSEPPRKRNTIGAVGGLGYSAHKEMYEMTRSSLVRRLSIVGALLLLGCGGVSSVPDGGGGAGGSAAGAAGRGGTTGAGGRGGTGGAAGTTGGTGGSAGTGVAGTGVAGT